MEPGARFTDSLLRDLSFCSIDCETTGVNPLIHEIIEVAAVRFTLDGGIGEVFHSLVKPEGSVPAESMSVHGIGDELLGGAPPFSEIGEELLRHMDGAVIVGHNVQFDIAFLTMAAGNGEVPVFQSIDTEKIARHVFPGLPNYRLGTVCARLGLAMEYHRALPDACGSVEIFMRALRVLDPEGTWRVKDLLGKSGPLHKAGKRARAMKRRAGIARSDAGALGTLLIRYRGSDGAVTERTIDPLTVIRHGDRSYLRAYCHLKNDVRLFRMDRITILSPQAAATAATV